jgi:hypothetical protein
MPRPSTWIVTPKCIGVLGASGCRAVRALALALRPARPLDVGWKLGFAGAEARIVHRVPGPQLVH